MAMFSIPRGTGKRAGALLGVLSTVLFFSIFASCGLPTVTYLYPPKDLTVDKRAKILSVKNNSYNYDDSEGSTQTYRGIEVYYRVYDSDTKADAAITNLNALADTYTDDPDSFMSYAESTYKFSRLRKSDTSAQPLISIDAADESYYYINLDIYSNWRLTDDNSTVLSYITRTLDNNTNSSSLSFFDKDFNSGDFDFAGTTSTSTSDTVYIVFFAVSYGIDQSTVGQTVYSAPYVASSYAEY